MKRLAIFVSLAAASALAFASCSGGYRRFQAHMIGPFDTVTVFLAYAESERAFSRYADIVFGRLEELHRLFDIFNAYEGVNNLHTINANAGIAPVAVEREVIDMLLAAREGYRITGGMTNAAMGAVLRIWHDYRGRGLANPAGATLPPMPALREAGAHIDMANVVIDEAGGTVFLRDPEMSLDGGAVAKGYAVELAFAAAQDAGLRTGLLSVGGHVIVAGAPPGRGHWNVAVQNPEAGMDGAPDSVDTLAMTSGTVSVSGAYQRFFMVDGRFFGHVIDPATLMPADLHLQVTVIHPRSWMADVLSTALFVLPMEEGFALATEMGAEAFWIDRYGGWFATPGYGRFSSAFGQAVR